MDRDDRLSDESPNVVVEEGDFDRNDILFRTNEPLDNVRPQDKQEKRKRSLVEIFSKFLTSPQNLALCASVAVHAIIVLILLSVFISVRIGTYGSALSPYFMSEGEEDLQLTEILGDSLENNDELVFSPREDELDSGFLSEILTNENDDSAIIAETTNAIENSTALESVDPIGDVGATNGNPFYAKSGESKANRRSRRENGKSGRRGDVSKESEDAVERGLDWLARHQLPDGGWSFILTSADDNGREGACAGCTNSEATSGGTEYRTGLHPSRTAATAIALLPFFGAGYVHTEPNKYQQTVNAGIYYLIRNARRVGDYVDFRQGFLQDGSAYVQALAVLVCCEAYEMTKDPNLESLARGGMLLIESAQLNDGGWRYYFPTDDGRFYPNVHGDTSVLGWQMLALKSGISAGFPVSPSLAYRAGRFLDLVSYENGRIYRYQPETKESKSETWGTTAVGALIREYLGWERGNAQLDVCVQQIVTWLDDADAVWKKVKKGATSERNSRGTLTFFRNGRMIYNLYFAYYATLALHNYGGKQWDSSFPKVRDLLVETQDRGGVLGNSCERGSWLFYDKYMNDGGRLLNTSLAILILETPYRNLPMYR